jgi:two-component system chemotaxis response regulator CheY
MPEMNGLEFVTSVRATEEFKKLPILMITTRGMKDDVLQAVQAGVNNYVVKPFTPETLEAKISKLLD